jgi:hypothetical protein
MTCHLSIIALPMGVPGGQFLCTGNSKLLLWWRFTISDEYILLGWGSIEACFSSSVEYTKLQCPWHFWALSVKFLRKKQMPEDILVKAEGVLSMAGVLVCWLWAATAKLLTQAPSGHNSSSAADSGQGQLDRQQSRGRTSRCMHCPQSICASRQASLSLCSTL